MTTKQAPSKGFTAEERAAMRERVKELKAEAGKAEGDSAVVAKIAEMSQPDRGMAERLHALVKATVPDVVPRLWYGMPAYAADGKTICFFKPAEKFRARYATLGFTDAARLDDGAMWPTEFALVELTAATEKRVRALLEQAVS